MTDALSSPLPSNRSLVVVRPVGKPRFVLSEELAVKILDMVADGMKVKEITALEGMPSRSTLRRWIRDNAEFRAEWMLAKEEFADDILRETIDIADGNGDDTKEVLGRSALRIETRYRSLAKMMPRKYRDDAPLVEPPMSAQDGTNAKVIEGETIALEQHPLYESVQAWRRVAKEAKG